MATATQTTHIAHYLLDAGTNLTVTFAPDCNAIGVKHRANVATEAFARPDDTAAEAEGADCVSILPGEKVWFTRIPNDGPSSVSLFSAGPVKVEVEFA